jgi:hypothetical protein
MKKFLFALPLLFCLAFTSCSSDDDEKKCWDFTEVVSTATTGEATTTETLTLSLCDLTEAEAKVMAEKMEELGSSSEEGVTITTTVTYKAK